MFERLEIPTPFRIGDVNAYLAGRTLVDPGPDGEEAWTTLRSELSARGLAPEDLSRVLVTHPHPDHFGLASRLREAGATVLASAEAAPILENFADRLAYEQSYFVEFFRRNGMEPKAARTVTRLPDAYVEFAPDVEVDRTLADGERVDLAGAADAETSGGSDAGTPGSASDPGIPGPAADVANGDAASGGEPDDGSDDTEPGDDASGGESGDEEGGVEPGDESDGELAVRARAVRGHAPGELLFCYDRGDERRALVGDHVLAEITPNPLLQPPPEAGGERPRVLPAFNESLSALRDARFDRFRTGHGEDVSDPPARVAEVLEAHEARTARVAELVDGPTTAREVTEGLFGDLPLTEYFAGMSEAVGHLDVLERRGEVRRREREDLVVYE